MVIRLLVVVVVVGMVLLVVLVVQSCLVMVPRRCVSHTRCKWYCIPLYHCYVLTECSVGLTFECSAEKKRGRVARGEGEVEVTQTLITPPSQSPPQFICLSFRPVLFCQIMDLPRLNDTLYYCCFGDTTMPLIMCLLM